MTGTLITVTTGAGGLAAAVAAVGLWSSISLDRVLDPASTALLVVGVVLLAIGFVAHFEQQSRLGATQMQAQLRARRRELQMLGILPDQAPHMR